MTDNPVVRPTNILVECPALIASVRLGVLEPLKLLEEKTKCIVKFKETHKIRKNDIIWCDVLIVVRACEEYTLNIVKAAKSAKRFIVYFLDDDLLNVPQEASSFPYYSFKKNRDNLIVILQLSDVLWGGNNLIGKKYQKYCNNWVVSDVPIHSKNVNPAQESDVLHVLYAGSIDHEALVREILRPVALKMREEFKTKVDFTFIGPDPQIPKCDGIRHLPYFDSYDRYKKEVDRGYYMVGLAPTRTSEFHKCKYYNKFIEYTSIGAIGIYSDCEPYSQIVKNDQNGFLSDNSVESWCNVIRRIFYDTELRSKCINNAIRLLSTRFSPDSVAKKLEKDIPQFVSYRAPEKKKNEIIKLENPIVTWCKSRMIFYWDNYNLLSVPIIIYKALKNIFKIYRDKVNNKELL